MIVLAIDPGSITAGYALLQKDGRKITYIASGILRFKAGEEFLHRVKDIYEQTAALVEQFQPDEIALESLIFAKSPTSLIKLAQARGTMLAAFAQKYHQKIFEYSPMIIKATVSGHGHTDKEGIQKVIKQYLGLTEFKTHDESDALAIALCHLLNHGGIMLPKEKKTRAKKGNGLANALAHRIKETEV